MIAARKAAIVPPAPLKPTIEIFDDIEQGTPAWFECRLGIPTASVFSAVMASGRGGGESEMRRKLLNRLAGEILTGEPSETFQNDAMRRGNEMEAEAREHYSFSHGGVELRRVGFVKRTIPRALGNPIVIGCSPDSLIGDDGALEVKTMMPALMIDLVQRAGPPPEHRAQCQGTLLVTGRKWIDLVFFYRRMPMTPVFRLMRDDTYIKSLTDNLEVFLYDLKTLVAKVKAMGR